MLIGGFGFLLDSLTNYYLFSILTTVFALAGTYLVCFHRKHFDASDITTDYPDETCTIDQSSIYEEVGSKNSEGELSKEAIIKNMELEADVKKPARIAEMVIKAGMSDEQVQQEKQTQKEQLKEIFRLMQQQADKFGSVTITDVEEQMKLYR